MRSATQWAELIRNNSGRDCLIIVSDDGRTVRADDYSGRNGWAHMYAAIIGAPIGWRVEATRGWELTFTRLD